MTSTDILGGAIAVTHDSVSPPESLTIEKFREILRPPLSINPSPDTIRIVSSRDQIEVLLSPTKTEVRDLSADMDKASLQLPRVLTKVVAFLPSPMIRSYEVNFILESQVGGKEPAGAWLSRTFLRDSLQSNLGESVSSDFVTLSYIRESKEHSLEVEAVADSRLSIRAYSSEPTEVLPNSEDLQASIRSQYEYLMTQLERIGF